MGRQESPKHYHATCAHPQQTPTNPRPNMIKSVLVALVVLAALLATTEAGPAPAQRKLKPLADVLKNDPSPSAKDSVVVAAAAPAAGTLLQDVHVQIERSVWRRD